MNRGKTLIMATVLSTLLAGTAESAIIAAWDFEGVSGSATGQSFVSTSTSVGTGTFGGQHSSPGTSWDVFETGGGNTVFRANDWSANDYFDFTTDAAGFENLSISFNLLQVGTPPLTFSVLYGVAGSAMIDSGVDVVADLTSFVVAKTALLSDPSVQGESLVIRIVANSDASAPLNSVRIDDVQILGDAIATPVPEPSAAVPWLVLGAAAVFRRKLRNKG